MPEVVDTIVVEIEARINKLRGEMGQAERIVGQATARMDRATKQGGPFAALGLGKVGGGFARTLTVFQLVRASLDGLTAAAQSNETGWLRALRGAEAFADTLTFGVHKAITDIIVGFTGLEQRAKSAMENIAVQAQQLSGARQRQLAEADVAIAEAVDPVSRAAAERRKSELELSIQASRLSDQGVRRSDVARIVGAERRVSNIDLVRGLFGNVSASQVNDILAAIEKNTRGAPR